MTSFELTRLIDQTLAATDQLQLLIKYLGRLQDLGQALEPLTGPVFALGTGSAVANQAVEQLKISLNKLIAETKGIKSSSLFANLDSLDVALRTFFKMLKGQPDQFEQILQYEIKEFRAKYDAFLDSRGVAEAFHMAEAARRLFSSFTTLTNLLRVLRLNLQSDVVVPPEDEYFQILISSVQTLKDVSDKAADFNGIYEELCQAYQLSSQDHPLRLAKLETGSFLLEFAGHPAVIAAMSSIVIAAIAYFHGRFTRQGKIEFLPKDVAAAEAILGLRNKLKEQGIDTGATDEVLNKVLIKIARQLNDALAYEPKIEVQGSTYEVSPLLEIRMLEAKGSKTLSSGPSTEPSAGETSI